MDEEKIGYKSYEPEHTPVDETDGETPDAQDDSDAAQAAVEILEEPATFEVEAEEVPIPQPDQESDQPPTVEVIEELESPTVFELEKLLEDEPTTTVDEVEPAAEEAAEENNQNFDFTPIVDAINKNASTSTSTTLDVGDDKLTIVNELTTGDLLVSALIAANVIVVLLTRLLIGR